MKTELEKIVSIAGKPGIYQFVSNGRQASVVESLVDGKRMPVYPTQKVSTLSDISMFTLEDDMPLRDILLSAKEVFKGGPAPDGKSESKVLRDALKKIVPNYDADRVYDSDIKKLLTWYNILQAKNMLDFAAPATDEEVVEEAPAVEEKKEAKAPKAAKEAKEPKAAKEEGEKPAPKKAAAKKAATRKKKEE